MISKIRDLETRHKTSLDPVDLHDLTQVRLDLQDLLGIQIHRRLILKHKLFYQIGNKCVRLLARALRTKTAALRVHAVKDQRGVIHTTSDHITLEFQNYYTQLYNLPKQTQPNHTLP